jgi:hypothetical protein
MSGSRTLLYCILILQLLHFSLLSFPVEIFYFHIPDREKMILCFQSHYRAPRGAEPHVAPPVRKYTNFYYSSFQLSVGYQKARTLSNETFHVQTSGRAERMSTRNSR